MRATPQGIRAIRRLLAAVALACLVLLALAGPALASPAWLAPTDLSAPLRDASHADVAMSDTGETVAVWERRSGTVSDNVQASTRSPGGSFSAPVDLALQAQDPELAMTPGGEAVAVWSHFAVSSESYVIQAATRSPGGSFSAPVDIFTIPKKVIPQGLRLAVSPAGDIAVIWEEVDPESGLNKLVCEEIPGEPPKMIDCPNPSFVMASIRPAGGSFSPAVRVSPPRGEPPRTEEQEKEESHRSALGGQVAIDAAGDVTVVWSYFDGEDSVVQGATWPAGGSFGPPETISGSGADTFSPDVAMDAAGNTLAVWSHVEGADDIAQASTRSPGGSFNPPVDLSAAGEDAQEPEAAMTPAGAATVIWTLTPEAGGRIIQATTRPSGGSFSGPQNLSLPGEEPLFPALAMNSNGAAAVAWSGASGPGKVTRAVTRAAGGGFSAPVEVSAAGSECCFHPNAAIDSAGDATVVWTRSNGSNDIAQAAGYDADAPELRNLSIPPTGTVGVPVGFSVDPFDVWPIASTKFDFGDGTSAAGTAVSHVYASPGTFPVTATTIDAAGTATTAGGTISILASNDFKLGKVKRNKKTGRATIIVYVPGPGKLTLSGKGVKKVVRTVNAAGAIRLTIAPNRRTLKKLNKRHKAKVKLTIVFAPTGGNPATKHLSVTLLKQS